MAVRRATTTDAATTTISRLEATDRVLKVALGRRRHASIRGSGCAITIGDAAPRHPAAPAHTAAVDRRAARHGDRHSSRTVEIDMERRLTGLGAVDRLPRSLPCAAGDTHRRPDRACVVGRRDDPRQVAGRCRTRLVMGSDEGLHEWMRKVAAYGFCIVSGTPPRSKRRSRSCAAGYVRRDDLRWFLGLPGRPRRRPTPPTPTSNCSPTPTAPTRTTRPACSCCTASPSTARAGCRRWSTGSASPARCAARTGTVRRAAASRPGQYIGDGSHLMSSRPVFRHDQSGELAQVSFNNADRAPFLLPAGEMELSTKRAGLRGARQRPPSPVATGQPARRCDVVRQLARAARPHGVHRPSPPVRRLRQPRGLREPSPPHARALERPNCLPVRRVY